MLGQPWLDFALGLHALLQLPKRRQASLELMNQGGFRLQAQLRAAPLFFRARQCFLRVGEPGLNFAHHLVLLDLPLAQFVQLRLVGRVEPPRFGIQPFAAQLELLQLLIGITLMSRFELERLLGLRDPGAFLYQAILRIPRTRFELG